MVLFKTGFKPSRLSVVLFSLSEEMALIFYCANNAFQSLSISQRCERTQLLERPVCATGVVKALQML